MKTVKIAELKDHLSEHLRAVERGAEVTVTDRDRPVARIVPILLDARLTVLPPKVAFSSIRARKWRRARWSMNSQELLAEERRDR